LVLYVPFKSTKPNPCAPASHPSSLPTSVEAQRFSFGILEPRPSGANQAVNLSLRAWLDFQLTNANEIIKV
jgi:hypothetical protein